MYLCVRSICCHILRKVSNDVSGGLDRGGGPGEAGGGGWVDSGGVVNKIRGKQGVCLDLFIGQISCQLVNNGGHHFQVVQFFGT